MHGKKYKGTAEKAPKDPVSVEEAVEFIKTHSTAGFDETVEIHVNLGVDASKNEQMVRASVVLPSGSAKQKKVVVITSDKAKQDEAKKAGAFLAGGQEIIDAIKKDGSIDADVVIASPEMMPKIAMVAKILGPKGLMPNPKVGSVNPEPAQAVKDLAGGKITFKMDNTGNIHESIGKVSWEAEKITANVEALLSAIKLARPDAQKGVFLQTITLSSTMGPGVRVNA